MYWISEKKHSVFATNEELEHSLNIAIGKNRLRDFKPVEGRAYYVRTSRKSPDFFDFVPVYIGKNGKLVKTNIASTGWF